MKEKWVVKNKSADFAAISARFGVSPVVARMLVNRGVTQEKQIQAYLHPSVEQLHEPELLKDAKKTGRILKEKIAQGKKIRIIGDYDVDGVVSTYIWITVLRECGADVDYVIPERIRDGYGINLRMVEEAVAQGVDTILTCDNGIAAVEQTEVANAHGLTVLITDHHELQETLPNAEAVVNPKQPDCGYPYKGLCGAAVAYKVAKLLFDMVFEGAEFADKREGFDERMLPFVAIATVCDVMELTGENRSIVSLGLELLRHTVHPGFRALMEVNKIAPEQLSAYHLGFVIGPCLNATGRLETAVRGVELLMAKERAKAERLAGELKELNEVRKDLTAKGLEQAVEQVETQKLSEDKVLVVYLPDCHESLAGIIAGRLREKYNRPSIVLTAAKQGLKGSGRSIEAYSMFERLQECRELLAQFGGHPMAAGLSLKEENLEPLRRKLNACSGLSEEDLIPKITIDAVLALSGLSEALVRELDCLEPFGRANEKPVFAEKALKINRISVVGKTRPMMKFRLEDAYGCRMDAMYFGDAQSLEQEMTDKYGEQEMRRMYQGNGSIARMSVIYYPRVNEFRGERTVEIVIQHYQLCDV